MVLLQVSEQLKIPLISRILLFYTVTQSTKFPLWPELVCF